MYADVYIRNIAAPFHAVLGKSYANLCKFYAHSMRFLYSSRAIFEPKTPENRPLWRCSATRRKKSRTARMRDDRMRGMKDETTEPSAEKWGTQR